MVRLELVSCHHPSVGSSDGATFKQPERVCEPESERVCVGSRLLFHCPRCHCLTPCPMLNNLCSQRVPIDLGLDQILLIQLIFSLYVLSILCSFTRLCVSVCVCN